MTTEGVTLVPSSTTGIRRRAVTVTHIFREKGQIGPVKDIKLIPLNERIVIIYRVRS